MELCDGIDIAAYSVMNAQTQTMQAIGTGILAKTLDTAEAAGAQLVQMMEQSVNPHLGGNIDVMV